MEIVNEIQWLPPLFKCCSIQVDDAKESEEEAHKSSPGIQDKMRLSGYFTLKKIIRDSDNSLNEINPSRSAELTLSISANMFLFYFGIIRIFSFYCVYCSCCGVALCSHLLLQNHVYFDINETFNSLVYKRKLWSSGLFLQL